MIGWRHLSIRARLTLFFAMAMSFIVLTYAAYVAVFVHARLKAERDHRLDQELEIAERSLRVDATGQLVWYAPHESHEAYQPLRNVSWLDLHRPDGTLIYRVPETDTPGSEAVIPPFDAGHPLGFSSRTAPNGAHLWVLQRDIQIGGERVIARAALSGDQSERDLHTLLWVMGIGLPIAIVSAGLGGLLLAGRALRPISRMVVEARAITAERLDSRLPIDNPSDELGGLAMAFNDLFGRLQRSFEELRRFTSDASHELRTPLAIIRTVGEVGLRERHDEAGYREIIGGMLEEIDHLALLIEGLLTLTRADAGQTVLALSPVDLTALAERVANHLQVLAEEKGQKLHLDANGPTWVLADAAILRQALVNLIDNAIKYTPAGGEVTVRVAGTDKSALLEVADGGPGIPLEHQEKIFERFYRIDAARSRSEGGFGLGLAIARWAVEAHGGTVRVASSSASGSVFRIELPLCDAPNTTIASDSLGAQP